MMAREFSDERQRVFERFYRIPGPGEGCGLRLSIVREIAEIHGYPLKSTLRKRRFAHKPVLRDKGGNP